MAHLHRTFCRNCPAACGLLVETENGRIGAIRGDRDHPITGGYLCIKGRMSGEWQNGEDRLPGSLKRNPDGAFCTIATQQALDEIHGRIAPILEAYGPRSLAVYFGTGSKTNAVGVLAMRSWLKMIGSPNLFSSSTVDQSAKWVTGGRMGAFLTGKHSICDADVVFMAGMNPLVSHSGVPALPSNNPHRWMREAKKRGVKIIVADPRRTETAHFADIHLQLRPGEDPALFAGIINIILANQWEDREFCARFTTSIERLRTAVAPFTADYAAARAGVPVEQLRETARLFAHASCRTAQSGTGPNMAAHSNLAEHLIEALNAICGAYRRAGALIRNPGALLSSASPVERVRPPNRSWDQEPKLRTENAGLLMGEFPSALLPAEILSTRPDRIRALIVFGGDPATAIADGDTMRKALRNLEVVVTIDPRMSETARLSDYVIPTKLPYERHDITYQFDIFSSEPFIQIARPLIDATHGMLDDWEIFFGLARRMDRDLLLLPYPPFGGLQGNDPGFVLRRDRPPETTDILRWLCERASLSYEDVMAHPEGMKVDRAPVAVTAALDDDGARLDLCPPDVAAELDTYLRTSDDVRFPYNLVVRRMIETMNSAFRNASMTRKRFPVNPAFMHPQDMIEACIAENAAIEIQSRHGRIVGYARGDRTLRRGVISMTHQWGKLDIDDDPLGLTGGFTGRLVSLVEERETINFMPRQSAIPVRIRALGNSPPESA
jgi:anaerobic selenocysteine-containing dehydrogenase